MSKNIYIIVSFAILIIFSGCSAKKYNIDKTIPFDNVTNLIEKNTPKLCSYKGRSSVKIEQVEDISFSILLNKKCNSDTTINILGALNQIIATIKYENGIITVITNDMTQTDTIKNIADSYIYNITTALKTPPALPNHKYKISYNNSSYIFKDSNNITLYADDRFRIYRKVKDYIISEYIWDDNNFLKGVVLQIPDVKLTIKFLNKTGWSDNDK